MEERSLVVVELDTVHDAAPSTVLEIAPPTPMA
jgi:hypothetical protein